jgi:hypothetical protein
MPKEWEAKPGSAVECDAECECTFEPCVNLYFLDHCRFINDFHGTGKMPNVRFETYVDERGELRLGVFVLKRKIKKGDEVQS